MAKPKFIKKEMLNKQRAEMMYEAIERVKQMSPDSIEAAVHQVGWQQSLACVFCIDIQFPSLTLSLNLLMTFTNVEN